MLHKFHTEVLRLASEPEAIRLLCYQGLCILTRHVLSWLFIITRPWDADAAVDDSIAEDWEGDAASDAERGHSHSIDSPCAPSRLGDTDMGMQPSTSGSDASMLPHKELTACQQTTCTACRLHFIAAR